LFKNKLLKNCPVVSYYMPILEGFTFQGREDPRTDKINREAIEREASEKGFASGEKAGYEMGEQKSAVFLDQLEKLLKEIYALKEKMGSELESQMVLLSIAMARRILKKELKMTPEIVELMVKEAIKQVGPIGPITIKLNPSLYDRLDEKKKEFQEIFPDLVFELDNKVPEGGSVVRSPSREIQTDLDFQLSNVVEDLRAHLENG
jgi:flagellar assembly protein FliH